MKCSYYYKSSSQNSHFFTMLHLQVAVFAACWLSVTASALPYMINPYYKVVGYNGYNYPGFYSSSHSSYSAHVPLPAYTNYFSPYNRPIFDTQTAPYANAIPSVNILAKTPNSIDKSFTVVPMLLVPEDNLNMISEAHIVSLSKKKPSMTVKTNAKDTIQCTPAVRIVLETPIVVYNLKTSIMFPSHMSIVHDNVRIPIKVGAVIAPVPQDTFISEDTPVSINVVYAIPTKPVQVDYVNNEKDVIIDTNAQAVIVETNEEQNTESKPSTEDDDDDELVNRNPPIAPAGIVQGSQPNEETLGIFHNSKESAVLTELREESKKRI